MLTCIFPSCDGHDDLLEALLHGQRAIILGQRAIGHVLLRIEQDLDDLHHEQEHDMSDLDARLADLKAAADTNTAKLARLIADFENAGNLTPEQTAALDALKAELVDNAAAIDAADPAAPPVAEPTV